MGNGINTRQFQGAGAVNAPWQFGANVQPYPQSPAAGAIRSPAAKNPIVGNVDESVYVFDKTRFVNLLSQYHTLSSGDSGLLLPEPQKLRTYLYIRIAASSTGSLGVSFNDQGSNLDFAEWVISPGDDTSGLFENIVPQNRLYYFAANGDVKYKLVYAEIS